jgi:hypothetical protein
MLKPSVAQNNLEVKSGFSSNPTALPAANQHPSGGAGSLAPHVADAAWYRADKFADYERVHGSRGVGAMWGDGNIAKHSQQGDMCFSYHKTAATGGNNFGPHKRYNVAAPDETKDSIYTLI